MKKCTQTDKLVSVVIAVYKPKREWFSLLLESIENQTYKNINVLIYDDCPKEPFDDKFAGIIKSFPVKIFRGKKNLGSNLAFEYLTEIAEGDYIAYCDQDDIWESRKIEKLVNKFGENPETVLVCSDLSVIDAEGKKIAGSYREISRRHIFYEGKDVFKHLIFRNFAVGCASMIEIKTAKKALRFNKYFYHDHWLALCASVSGNIAFIDECLIRYRIHGGNQTGVFSGINTKNDYFEKRIRVFYDRNKDIDRLKEISSEENLKELENIIFGAKKYARVRKEHFESTSISTLFSMLKFFKFGVFVNLFEIFLPLMPEFLFRMFVRLLRSNKI